VEAGRSVEVRSYRDVVDVVERRIFRVDRWRIPHPGGVPAAALGYFVVALVAVLLLARLPVVGSPLSLLDPALRLVGLPLICAWALVSLQVDGRRPHHALVAAIRWRGSARTLAGLHSAPAVGRVWAPVEAITIAPTGDESGYRPGRVRGPATVILRYPAELRVEGGHPDGARRDSRAALAHARRLRVRAARGPGSSRPLAEGRAIRVPAGAEVIFE